MTSPLHTKLKELRELREKLPKGEWTVKRNPMRDDGWFAYDADGTCVTFAQVSRETAESICFTTNNWLTLIAALERATTEMQTVLNVVSKHDTGQREYGSSDYEFATKRLSKALAEIAEMLK